MKIWKERMSGFHLINKHKIRSWILIIYERCEHYDVNRIMKNTFVFNYCISQTQFFTFKENIFYTVNEFFEPQ